MRTHDWIKLDGHLFTASSAHLQHSHLVTEHAQCDPEGVVGVRSVPDLTSSELDGVLRRALPLGFLLQLLLSKHVEEARLYLTQ